MRKFAKELENTISKQTKQQLSSSFYKIECPNCKQTVNTKPGRNICPICFNEINVDLKFDF